MPRFKRATENRQYPTGWVKKHGKIYYRVPEKSRHLWDGKSWFPLGDTDAEAYRTWHSRNQQEIQDVKTINKLLDKYLAEVVPDKTPNTQRSNARSIKRLRDVFGEMFLEDIKPSLVYKYANIVTEKHGLVTARHDVAVFRHSFTKAVQWGIVDFNPLIQQIRLTSVKPRTRDVKDWEIAVFLSEPLPTHPKARRGVQILQLYVQFKLMTGLRKTDILTLTKSNLTEDGIDITLSKTKTKTGRRQLYLWDDQGALKNVIDNLLAIPPKRKDDTCLFCTSKGKSYYNHDTGQFHGFNSMWQRYMTKLVKAEKLSESFQERDLRAKVAGDSESLEDASERLGHADTAITKRVYRRRAVKVQPLPNPLLKLSQSVSQKSENQ